MPEGMLKPGEVCMPLNQETNEGYLINEGYFVTNDGRYFSTLRGQFEEKTLQMNSSGYLELQVMTDHGQKHLLAHRGVLSTFCPRPDMHDLYVDHIHSDHLDNRVSELQWVTLVENNRLAAERGTIPARSRIITDEIIHKIMYWAKQGRTDKEISQMIKEIDITAETVRMVRTGNCGYGEDLKRLGYEPILKRQHTYLSQEDYAKIKALYQAGKSMEFIADELGVTRHTIDSLIRKWYGYAKERKQYDTLKKMPIIEIERRKKNPVKILPDRYKELDLYPVNIHTNPSRTLNPWYMITTDGRVFSMAKRSEWCELTSRVNEKGYSVIGLITTDGKVTSFQVHRLVMSTFCPRPDMYDLEVDHIHGNKLDNRLSELRWVTHKENMMNAVKEGLTKHKTSQRTISDEDIKTINYMAWTGHSDQEIYDHFDGKYTLSLIADVRAGIGIYEQILKDLDLVPFKRRSKTYSQEERDEIYEYVESRKEHVGMMNAYKEASGVFYISADAIRALYSIERKKHSNT